MGQMKLTNVWKETLHLELAPDETGRGVEHVSLRPKASIIVDAARVTDGIKMLAGQTGKRRHKKIAKNPPLKLEELAAEESADTSVTTDEYGCVECGRTFATERGLATHARTHEGVPDDSSSDEDDDQ